MKNIKKVWIFLNEDSWTSLLAVLVIAFIGIKFLFFPTLTFLTGSNLPLVIVESCSMYHHDVGFENSFENSEVYENYGISIEDTVDWDFQDGFSKGDIIFVIEANEPKVGDVIIFNGGAKYPLIHRVVDAKAPYATKGDNYKTNARQLESEKNINKEDIIGKALFRIRGLGWVKLIFFEMGRPNNQKGLCS